MTRAIPFLCLGVLVASASACHPRGQPTLPPVSGGEPEIRAAPEGLVCILDPPAEIHAEVTSPPPVGAGGIEFEHGEEGGVSRRDISDLPANDVFLGSAAPGRAYVLRARYVRGDVRGPWTAETRCAAR